MDYYREFVEAIGTSYIDASEEDISEAIKGIVEADKQQALARMQERLDFQIEVNDMLHSSLHELRDLVMRHHNALANKEEKDEQIRVFQEAMREIYEVWAGSEGISETTAPEAYNAHLIYQMRDIAKEHLKDG